MSTLKNLSKLFSRPSNVAVEISDKGVLHVDADRLLNTDSAKRQLEAVRRLQRAYAPVRRKAAR